MNTGGVHVVADVRDDQALLLHDAAVLHDRPIVVRAPSTGRTALARAVQEPSGAGRRISSALARDLGEQRPYFPIEWRRARWFDLVRHGDRWALSAIVLTAVAAVAAAVVAAATSAEQIGWTVAVLLAVVAIAAALATARHEARKLTP